ncbi:MAG: hypothetical protein ABIS23_03630 [Sphingomicrobium sp.]
MFSRRDVLLTGGAAGAAMLATAAHGRAPDPGEALADQLVAAMGGREAWTPLRGLTIRARHYETDVALPYDNALHIALAEPRMRFEGRNETMNRIRAVVGDKGWRMSEISPAGPLSSETVKSDLEWWETHAYRNVWRLARRDPHLTPRRHADGRLELYRPDGSRLMWYRLNQAGEPVAFGRFGSETTTSILGPLQDVAGPGVAGGVRLPTFSSSSDGTFRAVGQRATVYTTLPPVDWDKP